MPSLFSNGEFAERQAAADAEFDRQVQSQNIGSMQAEAQRQRNEHFDDLVEAGIPEDTVKHLESLLSRDFVLANLSSAEVNEMRWLARNLSLRVFALHPSKESHLTGEWRKFVLDEPDQGLKPLTDSQRTKIHSFILGYIARVSRSKGGWQQEELSSQYQVSEIRNDDGDDNEGWFR
jgi:hypothetical protein